MSKKTFTPAQIEAAARAICKASGHDPDSKEPGDRPRCDGRGYGHEARGEYREPWHWFWRHFTTHARAALKAAATAK